MGPLFVSAKMPMPAGLGCRARHEIVLSLELPAEDPEWVISDVNHTHGAFAYLLNSRLNTVIEPGAPTS